MLHERSGPHGRLDDADKRRHRPKAHLGGDRRVSVTSAGVLGLEPRMAEPESAVLPITPYPKGLAGAGAGGRVYLPRERSRKSAPRPADAAPTVLPGRGTIPAGDGSAPRRTRAGSDRGRSSQPG